MFRELTVLFLVVLIGIASFPGLVCTVSAISPGDTEEFFALANIDIIIWASAYATLHYYRSGGKDYVNVNVVWDSSTHVAAAMSFKIGKEFTIIETDCQSVEHHVSVPWHPWWSGGFPISGEGSYIYDAAGIGSHHAEYYFIAERVDYSSSEVWVELYVLVFGTPFPSNVQEAWDWKSLSLPDPPPPMGCPTLFVWTGTDFSIDNTLLPESARSNGTEVEDYYRLEQDLVPIYEGYFSSYYSLQISEFQQEHSYFDEADLFAVDHESDVSVAVSPTGELLTYQNPYPPIHVVDENNASWLDELSEIDGEYYEGYNGSYVILNFGEVNSSDAKLILVADPPPPTKKSIIIQVLNSSESWVDVVSIIPRVYWATDIIDLLEYLPSDGALVVRLYFTDNHRVDFVGLDTTPQAEIDVEDANLLWAYHSDEGVVTAALRSDDDVYAELEPDQQIILLFSAAKPDAEARTFIFYVKGYYYTITS